MKIACLSLLGLAVAACGSGGTERAPQAARPDSARTDSARTEPARTAAPDAGPASDDRGRVSIPADVAGKLDAWMARESTVIGDVVEIEATRIPFAAQVGIETSPELDAEGRRIVEKTESVDPATGAATVTLTNRSGVQTVVDALPRVRLGGGRLFIATDRIVLRYVQSGGVDRPVAISVTASGRARLVEAEPERKLAGSAIELRADVVRGPAGYEFRSSEERRP